MSQIKIYVLLIVLLLTFLTLIYLLSVKKENEYVGKTYPAWYDDYSSEMLLSLKREFAKDNKHVMPGRKYIVVEYVYSELDSGYKAACYEADTSYVRFFSFIAGDTSVDTFIIK